MEISHRPYPYFPLPGVSTPRQALSPVEPAASAAAPAERIVEGEWMEAGANPDYAPWLGRMRGAELQIARTTPSYAADTYRAHREPETRPSIFDDYA